MTAVLLALLALQTPVDEGTLVVREDTVEVAREAFRVTAVRTGAGGTRWTIATTIRYDRTRPVVVLDPIVELGAFEHPSRQDGDLGAAQGRHLVRRPAPRAGPDRLDQVNLQRRSGRQCRLAFREGPQFGDVAGGDA